MNFEDIKDKLREQVMILWSQIQETPLWNKLSEEFGNLSPRKQKGVLIALVLMGILIVLMIPYGFYSSTSDTVAEFDRKRDLIRELFKVKRESAILENAPPSISGSELQSRAQMQITNAHLAPEQTREITDYDNAGPQASSIIPKIVIQKGTSVSLSKLTLKQVVDIGHQLQSSHQSAKLVGLEVTASSVNPNYFDAVYKLISFTMPVEAAPAEKGSKKKPNSKFGSKSSGGKFSGSGSGGGSKDAKDAKDDE